MNSNTDIGALSNSISNGLASEQDVGLVLRTIQTTLSCKLLSNLESTNKGFEELNSLLQRCISKFNAQVTQLLEADAISHDELASVISSIQKNQLAFLELQRKIIQSPNKLFSDDLLSNDERKLLSLLKSFKTPEEKVKFLKLVSTALNSSNDFEGSESYNN